MPVRPAVLVLTALVVLGGCASSPPPQATATVTKTETASPSATPSPSSSTPEPTLTATTSDEIFLRSAYLLDPRLEGMADEDVRGFGRAGCEAVEEAAARGIDARGGFTAFVLAMRVNIGKDPSQRDTAQTLLDVARAGVPQFCPQYLDEASALEEQL